MQPAAGRLTLCGDAGPPLAGALGVLALPADKAALPPDAPPERQRRQQRAAARTALAAELAAALGLPAAEITLSDERGQPPQAQRRAGAVLPAIGLSIGHEAALSLVAWHWDGPVGVDVLRLPDAMTRAEMDTLSQLYLGLKMPWAVVDTGSSAIEVRAFALTWAMHEARLKCAGLALAEWTPALKQRLAGLQCAELALPAWAAPDHVAAVAWAPAPHLPNAGGDAAPLDRRAAP